MVYAQTLGKLCTRYIHGINEYVVLLLYVIYPWYMINFEFLQCDLYPWFRCIRWVTSVRGIPMVCVHIFSSAKYIHGKGANLGLHLCGFFCKRY